MKTTIKNQYASANNALIFFVSMLVGYNIYQEIFHPRKSRYYPVCYNGSPYSRHHPEI